jgi:multiple RNA-binding domain-containing protein 1
VAAPAADQPAGAAPAAARPAAVAAAAALGTAEDSGATVDAPPSATLFVKNLSFATDDAGLASHFRAAAARAGGTLRAARVARKKLPGGKKKAGAADAVAPSAGYGFVELSSPAIAAAVRAALQGSRLGGHALVLEFAADGGEGGPSAAAAAQPTAPTTEPHRGRTKLAVLNVAFQATRKDLASLAAPFGALKSVRLPKRASLDGSHRGYGFLDFATPSEAGAALAGLSGTHLYGRRLVLQWADADADAGTEAGLDELRARAAARSRADDGGEGGGDGGGGKRARRGA